MKIQDAKPKRLYLSAASIIAVVLLLFIVIGVSTYRNLDRQEKTALSFVHRQALTVLRAIEASARTGMMMHRWENDAVEKLIQETVRDENIVYIYLFNDRGIITHHSEKLFTGKPADWIPGFDDENATLSRILKKPYGGNVFELAKLYTPLNHPYPLDQHGQMMNAAKRWYEHSHAGDTIVLGMDMASYDAAQRADLQHSIIMAVILLSLGTGTIFFLFVIQNYYIVNRTLGKTRNYAQLVVNSMANGLLSIDPDGQIVSYNQQALEILGTKTAGARMVNLKNALNFKSTGIEAALQEGISVLDREVLIKQKSGRSVPIGLTVSPLGEQDGQRAGAVLILRDLTEIKLLEEKIKRSEKLAAVGRLAAGVAHEIRNPLSSIRGFVHFLKRALEDRPREKEYADITIQEIDRINRVITDLLVFSKPTEAELKPIKASALLSHVIKLIGADADSRNIVISIEITSCEEPVLLDFNQMTQVLLNLLLNAIQAVDEAGSVRMGATCSTSPAQIHLWVEDDGPGIKEEHKTKIFDPFFTSREEGTGLGLAIVNQIVENHGGEIWIKSPVIEQNRGCRVDIKIPVNTVETVAQQTSADGKSP